MNEKQPCFMCLIIIIVLSAVFSGTGATKTTITVTPSTTVAVINDSTFLKCNTSGEVEWRFGSNMIYSYGNVSQEYWHRFQVENFANDIRNQSKLVVQSVEKNDAGLYTCQDLNNQKEEDVHLTVLEREPACKSNLNVSELIGPNRCAVKPDTVQLSCSVRYIGSQVPELQWIKADENIAINSSICSASGNIHTCNLTMESELRMEGSSYVCQTTQSETRQYNCTSDVFGIIYALGEQKELTISENDTVNCSVNCSSKSCTYSWKYDSGIINRTESYDPVIELKRPGRYICEAICLIKDINCTIAVMTVYVNINAVLRNVFGDHIELNRTVNDTVNCSFSSSSDSCIFLSWIFYNDTTNWTESHELVIEFKRPGRFICQAVCEIWNINYTLAIMTVNVTVNTEPQGVDKFSTKEIVGIVAGVIAFFAICVGSICYLCKKKRRNPTSESYRLSTHQTDSSNRQDPSEADELLNAENVGDASDRQGPSEAVTVELLTAEHAEDVRPEQASPSTELFSVNVEHVEHIAEVQAANEQDQTERDPMPGSAEQAGEVQAASEQDQTERDPTPRSAEQAEGAFAWDIVLRNITPENKKKKVRGLAILNDELFLAFQMSGTIEAVLNPFRDPCRKIPVTGLLDSGTIAACAKNNCLYVIDQSTSSNKQIFRINRDGREINSWKTDDDDMGRISVNRDGDVVMTVYDKHKIKIYSPEGKLLKERTIDFSGTQIAYIFHAINLTDGTFIIGHGTYQSKIHQVCKIDATGKILRTFGYAQGRGEAQLNFPACVAETKDGFILVSDQENHRIILLNSELKFKKILFAKDNCNLLSRPRVMCVYDKNEPALLFLGCNETSNSDGYVLKLSLDQ